LRRLINGELGFRNFTTFLNSYRLAEVRDALSDPTQKDVPILTIAIDAGFGSLGPFNRAFREAEGVTPSEYRSRHI
jgi:AraC-like DNA-binding protein